MLAPNDLHVSTKDDLLAAVDKINSSSFENDGERSQALLAAYALVSRLESPWETVCRLAMAQVST